MYIEWTEWLNKEKIIIYYVISLNLTVINKYDVGAYNSSCLNLILAQFIVCYSNYLELVNKY